MSVLLDNSRFLHIPKTGGTWVRRALHDHCPAAQPFAVDGGGHTRWFETPARPFTFAFVRDPLTWWQSFWKFHKGPARRYVVSHRICSECWSDDFNEFIRNVVDKFPGDYSRLIEFYIGVEGTSADFIGRQENLVDDLLLAMEISGDPHDAESMRAVAPQNRSDTRWDADYDDDAREALLASEAPMIERFGYAGTATDPAMADAWRERLAGTA